MSPTNLALLLYIAILKMRAALAESDRHAETCRACVEAIHRVQQDLFDLGSTLATPPEHLDRVKNPITGERIAWLEESMDVWN